MVPPPHHHLSPFCFLTLKLGLGLGVDWARPVCSLTSPCSPAEETSASQDDSDNSVSESLDDCDYSVAEISRSFRSQQELCEQLNINHMIQRIFLITLDNSKLGQLVPRILLWSWLKAAGVRGSPPAPGLLHHGMGDGGARPWTSLGSSMLSHIHFRSTRGTAGPGLLSAPWSAFVTTHL